MEIGTGGGDGDREKSVDKGWKWRQGEEWRHRVETETG